MEESALVEKQGRWGNALVAVVLLSFVLRVCILLNPLMEPAYQMLYGLIYVAAGALVLRSGAPNRETGLRLALLCFLWAALACCMQVYDERGVYQLSAYFIMLIFGLFVCFPMAFVLDERHMHGAMRLIAGTYVALIFGLCAVGVYAALSGSGVPSLAGAGFIGAAYDGNRLTLFAYPTISATYCCLALLVGLYLLLDARRVWSKMVLGLALLVIFTALALTDSRTSSVFFSLCVGGLCYLLADERLAVKRALMRALWALVAAALGAALCYGGQRLAFRAVNALAVQPMQSAAQPAAPADDASGEMEADAAQSGAAPDAPAPAETDAARDAEPTGGELAEEAAGPRSLLENISTLQGRTYAWAGAIRALQKKPALLLFGSSPLFVMDAVGPYITELFGGVPFAHLHSIFFQTLITFGLPGLLLFGTLACYILFHALRLFFGGRGRCTAAERALALLLFFCLAADLLETFLSFYDVMKHSNPWFFLVGGYVIHLSKTRVPRARRTGGRRAPADTEAT